MSDGFTAEGDGTVEVCRCAGCEKVFGRADGVEKVVIEGELTRYDEPRCPFCGTPVSDGEVAGVEF